MRDSSFLLIFEQDQLGQLNSDLGSLENFANCSDAWLSSSLTMRLFS